MLWRCSYFFFHKLRKYIVKVEAPGKKWYLEVKNLKGEKFEKGVNYHNRETAEGRKVFHDDLATIVECFSILFWLPATNKVGRFVLDFHNISYLCLFWSITGLFFSFLPRRCLFFFRYTFSLFSSRVYFTPEDMLYI